MKPKYGDSYEVVLVTDKRLVCSSGAGLVYKINPELGDFITIKLGNGQVLNIDIQPADEYDPKVFIQLS